MIEELFQGSSFATGVEYSEKRKRVNVISTGSKAVDGILGGMLRRVFLILCLCLCAGGLISQSISEGESFVDTPNYVNQRFLVYGEFRTGKTQLAHTLSVVAQLPAEMGGAAGKVYS